MPSWVRDGTGAVGEAGALRVLPMTVLCADGPCTVNDSGAAVACTSATAMEAAHPQRLSGAAGSLGVPCADCCVCDVRVCFVSRR